MPGSAAISFAETGEYRQALADLFSQFIVTQPAAFAARVTRAKLLHFDVVRCEEAASRVAFVTLSPELVFFSFPFAPYRPLLWCGTPIQPGELMMHGRGEGLHQRIIGPCHWGMMSLPAASFAAFAKALTGSPIETPPCGQVLRPAIRAMAELLRLHASVGHLAETRPQFLRNAEAARGMENEIAEALVWSVSGAETRNIPAPALRAEDVMIGLERILAKAVGRPPSIPHLATELGVTDRTLRHYCSVLLGVGPFRYMQLQRLQLVRSALLRADPATARVADIAAERGFSELGRLAALYRANFGEAPNMTLRRKIRL